MKGIRGPIDDDAVRYGYTRKLATNVNLIRLLEEHFEVELGDVFGTNLFPFIKPGGMGTPIPRRELVRAALEFALPQVRWFARRL